MNERVPRRAVLQCRYSPQLVQPGIPVARISRGACATVIARVPMRTVLQCRHSPQLVQSGIPFARASRGARATVTGRFPRRTVLQCRQKYPPLMRRLCYSDRSRPEAYCATVSSNIPSSGNPGYPSRALPNAPCYSDHTRPEAYCATVSPCSPSSCNPASRCPRRVRFPRRPCYSYRTRPEVYCTIMSPSSPLVQPGIPGAHASRWAVLQ